MGSGHLFSLALGNPSAASRFGSRSPSSSLAGGPDAEGPGACADARVPPHPRAAPLCARLPAPGWWVAPSRRTPAGTLSPLTPSLLSGTPCDRITGQWNTGVHRGSQRNTQVYSGMQGNTGLHRGTQRNTGLHRGAHTQGHPPDTGAQGPGVLLLFPVLLQEGLVWSLQGGTSDLHTTPSFGLFLWCSGSWRDRGCGRGAVREAVGGAPAEEHPGLGRTPHATPV